MKIWQGYGSEHSTNLVMIGTFEKAKDATDAEQVINAITSQVKADIAAGNMTIGEKSSRFSEIMLDLLVKTDAVDIGSSELQQFAYDINVQVDGNKVVITTEEIDVSGFLKLLINHGASREALVPAPLYQGMRDGKIVRFEEITRTPLEVQDCLLGMLSDRVMTVPELTGEASQLYAREGFNIIATANTRDRGVNEMSAALKRRFDFETVFPIMDFAQELELVASASARLLAHSGIPHKVPDAVLELLVRTFRDLRANGEKKTSMDTLTAIMSTAEAVNVAHAVGVRAWFLANRAGEPADLVECIAGTIVKDNEEDRARLRRYFEQRVATHKEAHWQAYYQARHRLP